MKNSKDKAVMVIAVLEVAIAVFMVLAVKLIAPVCPGMLELISGKQVHMKCYYASVVFVFLAVLLAVCAVLCFLTKQGLVCGVITVVIAVIIFVTFNDSIGIGICANPDMACQMTAPFVKVSAMAELLLGVLSIVQASKKGAIEK